MGTSRAGRTALGAAAARGVKHMAHRFIVGESPRDALGVFRDLWKDGVASSVDLLGEATVTQAEAQRYAERCDEALDDARRGDARAGPRSARLEPDSFGPLPRANLSVKVSALTPLLQARRAAARPARRRPAPARPAAARARARRAPAHRHGVDGLARRRARADPRACSPRRSSRRARRPGVVLQAYLRDSPGTLDTIVEWIGGAGAQRAQPLTVRLVKGAYWDHEIVEAVQHGWQPPVFEVKADSDLNFELLTRGLIDHRAEGCGLRPAIASHNLRSVAHAIAYNRLAGGDGRRRRDADPARPRRPAADRDRRAGPARARLLPGRRPRRGHGLPRAAAAREHEQRLLPQRPGARRADRGAARQAAPAPA